MIILKQEILKQNNELIILLEKEKESLNSNIKLQQQLKEILLEYVQKFVSSSSNINKDYTNTVLNFLEDLKKIIELSNQNLTLLDNLLKLLDEMLLKLNNASDFTPEYIDNFNNTYLESNETLSKNTLEVELFLHNILPFLELKFSTTPQTVPDISTNTELVEEKPNTSEENNSNSSDMENTLIISEKQNKIFLPYFLPEIEEILANFPDQFSSIEDVIEKKYTLPFESFKNMSISRFREAFYLVKTKEKKSTKAALDLGLELLFNHNLHPAIIAACRNLDELDIYLDYLKNNQTDKFDCFKIIFDISPL